MLARREVSLECCFIFDFKSWMLQSKISILFLFVFLYVLLYRELISENIRSNIQYVALFLLSHKEMQHPKALLDPLPYALLCDWINDTVVMDDGTSFNLTCNSNMSSRLYLLPCCFRNSMSVLHFIRDNPVKSINTKLAYTSSI